MPFIPFPDVPSVPGVPALPRAAGAAIASQVNLGPLRSTLWRVFQVQTQWGIFDAAGNPLGDPAKISGGLIGAVLDTFGIGATLSTGAIEYSKETKVSDFPIERGSFASYNKVEMPASPVVTLCLTGSETDRRSFLDAIDAASKSTDLYSVVTPEITYINHAVERYSYSRRSSKGATLLMVEITLKEIRQVSAAYSSIVAAPKNTGSSNTVDAGKVQPTTPPTSTLKGIANKLPALSNSVSNYLQGLTQ